MSHCLIEQTMVNPRQVFGIVKERIVTTQPCSVIEEVQQTGQFSALLSLCGPTTTKVCIMCHIIHMFVLFVWSCVINVESEAVSAGLEEVLPKEICYF